MLYWFSQEILTSFMEKYWKEFDESEENKIIYTEIFNEYTNSIENYIEEKLKQQIDNFDMNRFANELQ